MNDSKYWESQSAAMLREYRTLQGFVDVARNEGTPEMVEATSAAMGAVWRLVEACDRRAKQESRHEVQDCPNGETAEEPPFAEQERAAGNYDGDEYDPCHQRQRQITLAGADR